MNLDDFSFPLPSGFRRLTPEEQAEADKVFRQVQAKVLPFMEECDRLRRLAEVEARTAFLG